jgi:glutathione S-transferase
LNSVARGAIVASTMRTLYHAALSPFSRRVRLMLAHKGLEVALKDTRVDPAFNEEARQLWAPRTIPVLVEAGGVVIGDSNAVAHYLDSAYPDGKRLWPLAAEERALALRTASLVDSALTTIIDLGTRYYELRAHEAWKKVQDEMLGRAQSALNTLGKVVAERGPQPLTPLGWSAVDIYVFTLTTWLETLPSRVKERPAIAQLVSMPWVIPAPLGRWADAFRTRDDVRAL